jgi:hypothetical protein
MKEFLNVQPVMELNVNLEVVPLLVLIVEEAERCSSNKDS